MLLLNPELETGANISLFLFVILPVYSMVSIATEIRLNQKVLKEHS